MPVPAAYIDPPLTPEQMLGIIRRAFGDDAVLQEAIPVGGGTVNEAWRLIVAGQPETILRVAPSVDAAASGPSWLTDEGLRREQAAIALLPTLATILPRTIQFDTLRTIVPRDWIIQSIMPGVPWSEIDASLSDEERGSLWSQLWEICRAIHNVRAEGYGPAHDPHFATLADLLLDDAQGLLRDARQYQLPDDVFLRLIAIIDRERSLIDDPFFLGGTLIHSDLGTRHCFIQQDETGHWQIVGVIDWEFARFADAFAETLFTDYTSPQPDIRTYGIVEPHDVDGVLRNLYGVIARGWEATDQARLGRVQESTDLLNGLDGSLETIEVLAEIEHLRERFRELEKWFTGTWDFMNWQDADIYAWRDRLRRDIAEKERQEADWTSLVATFERRRDRLMREGKIEGAEVGGALWKEVVAEISRERERNR